MWYIFAMQGVQHKRSVVSVKSDGHTDPSRSYVSLSVCATLDSEKKKLVAPHELKSLDVSLDTSFSEPLLLCLFSSDDMDGPVEDIGSRSCVTRFVKTLLSIMEHGVKPHSKHLTEYFAFLYEFAKMGEEEVN